MWQLEDCTGNTNSHTDKPWGKWEREIDCETQGSVWVTKDTKPQLEEKTCGDCGGRRNSQPHRRVCWRNTKGLE